jgi:hypothetical protein
LWFWAREKVAVIVWISENKLSPTTFKPVLLTSCFGIRWARIIISLTWEIFAAILGVSSHVMTIGAFEEFGVAA